jgi:hypothetical protein
MNIIFVVELNLDLNVNYWPLASSETSRRIGNKYLWIFRRILVPLLQGWAVQKVFELNVPESNAIRCFETSINLYQILCFVDRASRYMHVMKPPWSTISSVYSVTIPLHVSGLLVAHHQEVTMYICNKWYVFYVLVDCHPNQASWQSTKTYNTYHLLHIHCYLLMMGK